EAEWEYAARAGPVLVKPLGAAGEFCEAANGTAGEGRADDATACVDRFRFTAPVGSFPPNAFGLYDLSGNAAEWVEDCYHDSYAGAPADGAPWTFGECTGGKGVRGGSWNDEADGLRPAGRNSVVAGDRYSLLGFRVARDLF